MKGPDDALRIDDGHRAQRVAGIGVEGPEALRRLAMRVKIRQQRMTDAAQTLCPGLERRYRVA